MSVVALVAVVVVLVLLVGRLAWRSYVKWHSERAERHRRIRNHQRDGLLERMGKGQL
jgi:hypothetical protein